MEYRILVSNNGLIYQMGHAVGRDAILEIVRNVIDKKQISAEQPVYLISSRGVELLTKAEIFPPDKPITYRQLLEALRELDDEQLDMSVSFLHNGEVLPVMDCCIASELVAGEFIDAEAWDEITDVVGPEQPLMVSQNPSRTR